MLQYVKWEIRFVLSRHSYLFWGLERIRNEVDWDARKQLASRRCLESMHSPPQRPRSFWSAPRIGISGLNLWPVPKPEVRHSRTVPVTNLIGSGLNLSCLQSHSKPECRWTWPGRNSWCWPKGARPLRTRMVSMNSGCFTLLVSSLLLTVNELHKIVK